MPDVSAAEPLNAGRPSPCDFKGSILKGETSVAEPARRHGLTVAEVEDWRDWFLVGAENAHRSRPKDDEALKDEQIKKLKQRIGDLVLKTDVLREALTPMEWTNPRYHGMLPSR